MRKYIVGGLGKLPNSDVMAVENLCLSGVPDINGCWQCYEYWIELKSIKSFPVFENTPIKIEHFTPQQYIWAKKRNHAGGKVYLMIKTLEPIEYYLFGFDGIKALRDGNLTKYNIEKYTIKKFEKRINFEELLRTLCK